MVFTQTTIPVPRVRRVIDARSYEEWAVDYVIVMDYVHGRTLDGLWDSMSLIQKLWVAIMLRRYVRQLQRIEASPTTPPGFPSSTGPLKSPSPVFGQVRPERGPFASYEELVAFFKERCRKALLPEDDLLCPFTGCDADTAAKKFTGPCCFNASSTGATETYSSQKVEKTT